MTVASPAPTAPRAVSFADVYPVHAALVWRVLRRMGVRPADLDDVCQEVFLIVHRKLAEFAWRSSLGTWVCGIAVRCASDYRRRAHIQRESPLDSGFDREAEATQDAAVERREARALLDRILGTLDEDKRAVFVLFELEGMSIADIAESLGCPVQTLYSRLHAARGQVEAAVNRLSTEERTS